jgi:hypothetical protein
LRRDDLFFQGASCFKIHASADICVKFTAVIFIGWNMGRSFRYSALAGALLLSVPAAAQTSGPAAPGPSAQTVKPSISKFRARHLRHSCATEAKEHAKEGAARDEYVEACYSREVKAIGQRRDCRSQARAKGLSNQPLRDFVKQCAGSEQKS